MSLIVFDISCIFGFDFLIDDSYYKNSFIVIFKMFSILKYGKYIFDEEERFCYKECLVYVL